MKPFYMYPILITTLFLIFSGCTFKSEKAKSSIIDSAKKKETTIKSTSLSTETVGGGKRLTDTALATYFPETFAGLEKSGTPASREMKNVAQPNSRLQQIYYGDGATIYISITDMADDARYINGAKTAIPAKDIDDPYFSSKSYITESGIRVLEMERFRDNNAGKIRTGSDVGFRNARFSIDIKASPELGKEALNPDALLKAFNETNLPELFNLAIPEVQPVIVADVNSRIALDCDKLLPVERVQSIGGTGALKKVVTDFEKEINCNRLYKYAGSSGSLVFIVTQYARRSLSKSAVNVQGNAENKGEGDIAGLGDSAHLEMVGDDYFLAVAHRNYLIELRSFKDDWDKKETCCVAHSKDQLIALAKDILPRLE